MSHNIPSAAKMAELSVKAVNLEEGIARVLDYFVAEIKKMAEGGERMAYIGDKMFEIVPISSYSIDRKRKAVLEATRRLTEAGYVVSVEFEHINGSRTNYVRIDW